MGCQRVISFQPKWLVSAKMCLECHILKSIQGKAEHDNVCNLYKWRPTEVLKQCSAQLSNTHKTSAANRKIKFF